MTLGSIPSFKETPYEPSTLKPNSEQPERPDHQSHAALVGALVGVAIAVAIALGWCLCCRQRFLSLSWLDAPHAYGSSKVTWLGTTASRESEYTRAITVLHVYGAGLYREFSTI
jgi:hypothetical protein